MKERNMGWFKRRKRPTDILGERGGFGMIPRWSAPPKRNTEEWIKYFSQSPRLAVVERIASDLSFATGHLYRMDANGKELEIERHPFLNFWNAPNPLYEMTGAALWRLLEIYIMLKGEGYFIIERDILGRPAELWPVPVHWVQMTPFAGSPFYTIRVTSGQLMQVSVDDMFVMKDLDPFSPFERGLGQSESIADEIETDEYAAKFQKNFFYNDATSGTILSMPEASRDQRERLETEWNNEFRGVRNSHKLHILKAAAQVLKLTDNMKDMDMIQGRTYMRDAVLEHYGVPREIMGITESSNRATSEAAQFIYAQNVLMPKLRRREEAVNRQLVSLFGEDLIWRYDDIVPRNQDFDKAKALDGWNSGLLTRNEARGLLDLPETENGDVFKTTFSDVFVRDDEDPAEVSNTMAELQYSEIPGTPNNEVENNSIGNESKSVNDSVSAVASQASLNGAQISSLMEIVRGVSDGSLGYDSAIAIITSSFPYTKEQAEQILGESSRSFNTENSNLVSESFPASGKQKAARLRTAIKSISNARREESRRFEIALKRYFMRQKQRIAEALSGTQKAENSVWDKLNELPEDEEGKGQAIDLFILNLLNWGQEEKALEEVLTPLWRSSYQRGGKEAANLYKWPSGPDLSGFARFHGAEKIKIKDITETTKNSIRRIVSNAIDKGTLTREIVPDIMQELNVGSGRARVIANQETATSLMTGQFDMMRINGAKTKTWRTSGALNVRDSHRKLNNMTIPMDSPFPNGCMYPCDPNCNDPAEVVNCHCIVTYDNY